MRVLGPMAMVARVAMVWEPELELEMGIGVYSFPSPFPELSGPSAGGPSTHRSRDGGDYGPLKCRN